MSSIGGESLSDLFQRVLLVLMLLAALPAGAQGAGQLSQVKRVYVDSFGNARDATAMRKQVVDRLRGSGRLKIVSDAKQADAVVKGTGQTWLSGHVFLSRSHSVSSPVYQGFLSVQIIGKGDETLWSYLVTPSKFSWTSVPSNLANQMAAKLIAALKEQPHEESVVAAGAEDTQGTLHGAGATFPAPLYQEWFQFFEEHHPGVRVSYEAVGSGEGIRRLKEGGIDFGASDMPVPDDSTKKNQKLVQVPTVLGAVVPIYNVAGLHQPLRFTPEVLAKIYLGQIKKWNDPELKSSNRDTHLPDADIVVVHRSDGSGTTFVWTDYLSKVSPQWKSSAGSGVTVQWPAGIGAEHNEGVATTVQNTPDSMGYVELIYAIQHELSFGAVRNSAGQFIRADIPSVAAAAVAASSAPGPDLRASITDAPGTDVYPIASYTWLLLLEAPRDQEKKAILKELLRWMLTSGQKSCSGLGYVPLPPTVVKRAFEIVDTIN